MISLIAEPLQQSVLSRTKTWCRCWEIIPAIGDTIRYTDFDGSLLLPDGHVYSAAGGATGSAVEEQARLEGVTNTEYSGVIVDDAITKEDIQAGKYRNGEVVERIVDWRRPWRGAIKTRRLRIIDLTWSGEVWQVKAEGLGYLLRGSIGSLYTTTGTLEPGDANYGPSISAVSFTVTGLVDARLVFLSLDLRTTYSDDYFRYGRLEWLTGDNAGFVGDVEDYRDSDGRVTLRLRLPFDVSIGDTGTVMPGDDRTFDTAINKFNRAIDFDGFPYLPGTDRISSNAETQ